MGVTVLNSVGAKQALVGLKGFNDGGASLPNVHATEERQVIHINPVTLNRIQDVVMRQPVSKRLPN